MTDEQKNQQMLDELSGNYSSAAIIESKPEENDNSNALQSEEPTNTHLVSSLPQPNPAAPVDIEAPFGRFSNGKPRKSPQKNAPVNTQNAANAITADAATVSGVLIDGAIFILMVDMVFPLAIALVNNYFSEDKINPERLKLTPEQRKQIEPIIDKVMKNITMTGNPFVILFFTLVTAYGVNFMAAKFDLDKPAKK